MKDAVAALGAAHKITADDRYVIKAAQLLKVFFLDLKTRMNPNLQFAQAIPGVSFGRGIGIIDTLHLIEIPCEFGDGADGGHQRLGVLPADLPAISRQDGDSLNRLARKVCMAAGAQTSVTL